MTIASKEQKPYGNGRFCVLMTATVAPKGQVAKGLLRADPKVRLGDYLKALEFWMQFPDPRIGGVLFAENSGYPLEELEKSAQAHNKYGRRLEFLSTDAPPVQTGMHYGYSEFALVDFALTTSKIIAEFPYFIKATGRYQFPTLTRLLNKLPSDFLIAGDSQIQKPFSTYPIPIMTAPLILARTAFFIKELSKLYQTMVPAPPWTRKQFIEPVLYDHLYPMIGQPGIVLRWPCNCDPVGIDASHGKDFTGRNKQIKSTVRAALRRFAPNLWW